MATEAPLPTSEDWVKLVALRARGSRRGICAIHRERIAGETESVVWSDSAFQLDRLYVDNYHAIVDRELRARVPSSESLVEFFVPRASLPSFLEEVRTDFLRYDVALLYGLVRLAEQDTESFLAWARQPCAGVVFKVHMVPDEAGKRALTGDLPPRGGHGGAARRDVFTSRTIGLPHAHRSRIVIPGCPRSSRRSGGMILRRFFKAIGIDITAECLRT